MNIDLQFEQVLTYIDNHLDQSLELSILARLTEVPVNHFECVFQALYHTRLDDYIALLRILEAAQLLGFDKQVSIEDIAKSAGYGSVSAFNQTFLSSIGQTPQEFRLSPDWGNLFHKQQPLKTLAQGHDSLTEADVHITIETLESIPLVLIRHRAEAQYVPQSVKALAAFRQQHQLLPTHSRTFHFIYNQPHGIDDNYHIDIAASVPVEKATSLQNRVKQSPYFHFAEIPNGHYAVFTHRGTAADLHKKLAYLYGKWLVSSDYKLCEQPLIFERLDAGLDSSDMHVKVWLRITDR
ncbi:AraC family transcriptional regulator [Shewanella aestuarii]|uniref:AraC family transcriptional regulator n=1 Tax=Shewanella aestuarii TaxID=1028752 RepID=A0A6G9QI01_9GAMM|nr:GyrI-like domain-containing protein [Shewanella aestuarii]QIR14170.1 AraC family transcriptional regulator [Shewanella aestuarii]